MQILATNLTKIVKADDQAIHLERFLLDIHQKFLEKIKSYRFEVVRHECNEA